MSERNPDREVVLFFAGNTMTFFCCRGEQEDGWRKDLDKAIQHMSDENKGSLFHCGGTTFLINHNFLGYQVRNRGEGYTAKHLAALEKMIQMSDPDADAPWRQGE